MTIRRARGCRTVAILAVMLGTLRCGGPPAEAPGSGGTATAQSTPSAQKRNACLLVDREDMERLAQGKVTLAHNIVAAEQTNCEVYRDGDSSQPLVLLEVQWTGGRELVRTKKAAGLANQILNSKDANIEALTGGGPVPGGADDAYYSDVLPSWVLKGDVMIKFTMPGLGADVMRPNFVPLARKALARL